MQPTIIWDLTTKDSGCTDKAGFSPIKIWHVDGKTDTVDLKLVSMNASKTRNGKCVDIYIYVNRTGQYYIWAASGS